MQYLVRDANNLNYISVRADKPSVSNATRDMPLIVSPVTDADIPIIVAIEHAAVVQSPLNPLAAVRQKLFNLTPGHKQEDEEYLRQMERIVRAGFARRVKDNSYFFKVTDTDIPAHTDNKRLIDLDTLCHEDKDQIWQWNAQIPRRNNSLLQDLFSQHVVSYGDRIAVDSWDGTLSYAELDKRSTILAARLLEDEIAIAGQIVPLCFEKTIWTTITILALAKTGCTFVLLDPHQPSERLRSIMGQLEASTVLARPETASIASPLAQTVIIVDDTLLQEEINLDKLYRRQLSISPTDTLYLVFTSGSTGIPKGVRISHANLCSAATHQARALGFANARTLDSSSYSFDAYIFNTFYTLLSGGCLCVCSDTDRMNKLQATLRDMKVTLVQLTPSLSQVLDPASLPDLRTLILTGEKLSESVLNPWLATGRIRVINAYGPTECTIMCAANTNVHSAGVADSVGHGLGATLWIADVNDINRLAPIGAVGELLIEGPLIGQGYLGDEEGSQDSLISPPAAGYLAGVARAPHQPLFRTRDLARYNPDGSITYIGRMDTQIKINGQRVEVGEIEHWLSRHWPQDVHIVVDAVKWPTGATQLIAFVGGYSDSPAAKQLQTLVVNGHAALSDHLPKYMIPSAYFPVQATPMTASGKTDRKTLRQLALAAPSLLLSPYQEKDSGCEETTDRPFVAHELLLREQWAKALDIAESSVQLDDNFFATGDSLAAIRLVTLSRSSGLADFTVADVFRHPKLADLAYHIGERELKPLELPSDIPPFSQLCRNQDEVDMLRLAISQAIAVDTTDVEDAYPCSPIQEEMMALSAITPRDFVTREVLQVPADVDMSRLLRATQSLALSIQILRTRIIHVNDATGGCFPRLVQVVVGGPVPVSSYSSLETCLQNERDKVTGLGDPLFRLAIADGGAQENMPGATRHLVLLMHHAIYDGWFVDLLMKCLRDKYAGQQQLDLVPYHRFIQHLESSEKTDAENYWQHRLDDLNITLFPEYPAPNYRPTPKGIHQHRIPTVPWARAAGVTPSTLIHAAWATVLSSHSDSEDVVFGATLLGRQIPMTGIENVAGPTIATVPVRIKATATATLHQFLQTVQTQAAEMIPFCHFGIRNIRGLSLEAEMACQFRSFLVIQPPATNSGNDYLSLGRGSENILAFNTYALMLECQLDERGGLEVRASFDEDVLDCHRVQRMIHQMEQVLDLLCSADQSSLVSDVLPLAASGSNSLTPTQPSLPSHFSQIALYVQQSLGSQVSEVVLDVVELPGLSKRIVGFLRVDSMDNLKEALSVLNKDLINHFPRRLIPSYYLPLHQFPLTVHGKPDRDELRTIAREATPQQLIGDLPCPLDTQGAGDERALTSAERSFQRLWASAIGIPVTSINKRSSFLFLGGDSLAAMKFVAAARDEGYSITVAEVLKTPILAEMAVIARCDNENRSSIAQILPFSLLGQTVDRALLASACNAHPDAIQDAYPCSPLQESMISRTLQRAGHFVSQGFVKLPPDVDFSRLEKAWQHVARVTPILRTRIVDLAGHGLYQVVVDDPIPWSLHDGLDSVPAVSVGLGDPLIWLCAIKSTDGEGNKNPSLRLTIHHALYDRWSISLILRAVESVYAGDGGTPQPLLPFNIFINYLVQDLDEEQAKVFWGQYLSDLRAREFPSLPNRRHQPTQNAYLTHPISGIQWPKNSTATTVLKAAWAIVASLYTNCDDVLFGLTVMGRQVPIPGIEAVIGPTIATVPVRVLVDWQGSPPDFLQRVQSQGVDMIPVEQYGLGRICRLSADADMASQFRSLLVVQPPQSESSEDEMFGFQLGGDIQEGDIIALTVECTIQNDLPDQQAGVFVHLSYDMQVLDQAQSHRIASLLEHVVRNLCSYGEMDYMTLADIDMLTEADRHSIWTTNLDVPQTSNSHLSVILPDRVADAANTVAICAWDGDMTYAMLYEKAWELAYTLVVTYNCGPEVVVPICSAKSRWVLVAVLAVVMSGGVILLMDPSQPIERLQGILKKVDATFVLTTSCTTVTVVHQLGPPALAVDKESTYPSTASSITKDDRSWVPKLQPEDAAYIIFTSGSTGVPKGAIITHANCCSALFHQSKALGITKESRVTDLSSYAFDVCFELYLNALYSGGCICIPSDEECLNDMSGSIRRFEANYLELTPSVARLIDPATVPSLGTVVFGGEAVCIDDVTRWPPTVKVRNAYGPCECTSSSTIGTYGEDFFDSVTLGLPYGVNSWIISTVQPNSLAPVGGEGELVLEGPLVGRGYLNAPDQNAKAFVNDPNWLLRGNGGSIQGRAGRLYRTGDLVKTDSRGRLVFLGRKDAQVKIRGQRVEMEEIETRAREVLGSSFSVAAEVIETHRGTSDMKVQTLTLFVCTADDQLTSEGKVTSSSALWNDLSIKLAQTLPRYMVPSAFVRLERFPMTTTGKIDRRALRAIGVETRAEDMRRTTGEAELATEQERLLARSWGETLGVTPDSIGRSESFFDLGGDSLAAIHLVGVARKFGLRLTVLMIFRHPTFEDMARQLEEAVGSVDGITAVKRAPPHEPRTLPTAAEVADMLSVDAHSITDILPVTEFQEYAIRCTLEMPRTEWNYLSVAFPAPTDEGQLRRVCDQLFQQLDVFRSVFAQFGDRHLQVFLDHLDPPVSVTHTTGSLDAACTTICEQDLTEVVLPGSPFVRCNIIIDDLTGEARLVLGLSHACYDGVSLPLLAECIGAMYEERPLPAIGKFASYLRDTMVLADDALAHWSSVLKDSPAPTSLSGSPPEATLAPQVRRRFTKTLTVTHLPKRITPATAFFAALSAGLATITGQDGIVIGRAVSGRANASSSVALESIIGPCLNIVPARTKAPVEEDSVRFLETLQEQFTASIPHETIGLAEIVKHCTAWPPGTSYGCVFYYQGMAEPVASAGGHEFALDAEPIGHQEREEVEEGFQDPDELRNWWARFRARHPEPLAEFLATIVSIFLGIAGTLTVSLSTDPSSIYGTFEVAWSSGFAWMLGIYIGGGVSGAHMNPVVSVSLSIFRRFPWRQCAVYVLIQLLAATAAGSLAYAVFRDSIRRVDPAQETTWAAFCATPQEWMSTAGAVFSQLVQSAIMMIMVFALGDDQNDPPGAGMHAFILGLLVTSLKLTLGHNTGSALNPAADFGPRLVMLWVGYDRTLVFGDVWWIIGPWAANLAGAIVGGIVYDGFIFADIAFEQGIQGLHFYKTGTKRAEHDLPCKVSCATCGSFILDEGRNMLLISPSLLTLDTEQLRKNFDVRQHLFYSRRVSDIADGKPKWAGLNGKSELLEEG
ncbi:C6 transcription factor [Purpureocillium lavendulum]|uniref:C6 transcription factor n=1 Tax=Purpureocillium lavendulum TaxID=1247861 RepID=A0AB34FE18_9HYPO|nr:C6 transcription factor [Purpureocillium lavendulum]